MADQRKYEDIAVIKPKDAIVAVADTIRQRVKVDWINNSEAQHFTPEERIWGAVESALDVLQHGTHDLPPFNLVVAQPHYYPEPIYPVNDHPDYLMRRFEVGQVVVLRDPNNKLPSLTDSFAKLYETNRRRFESAAKDLFATYAKSERTEKDADSDVD